MQGLALLLAGVGADGVPQLWSTDPSGVYSAWKAHAVGRNSKSLLEMLEKNYASEGAGAPPTEAEAVKLAVRALLEIVESGAKSLEVAVLRGGGAPMALLTDAQLEALVAQIEAEKQAEADAGVVGAGGAASAAPAPARA